mmetsp:Transcript_12853/g.42015  ORF Transcript_12853/g.42015 Transcript_12853/m.42015 type:complete len:754 (+) Transcript_12853:891-3152(+)
MPTPPLRLLPLSPYSHLDSPRAPSHNWRHHQRTSQHVASARVRSARRGRLGGPGRRRQLWKGREQRDATRQHDGRLAEGRRRRQPVRRQLPSAPDAQGLLLGAGARPVGPGRPARRGRLRPQQGPRAVEGLAVEAEGHARKDIWCVSMPEGEVNVLGPPLGVGGRLEVEHDRHPGWDRVRDDRLGAARAGRRPEVVRAVRPQAVRREQAKRLSVCVRAVLGRVVAKGARLGERVGAAGRRQERLHVVQVQVGPRRVGRCELPHQRRRPCRAVDELVVVDVQQVGEAGGAGGRDGPGDVRRLPVHLLEVVALVGRREAGLHQGVPGGRRQQRLERGSVFDSDVEALHSKSLVVVRQPRLEVGRALDHRHHRHGHAVRDSGVAATVPVAHRRGRRPGAGRHDEDGVWVARLHVVGRSLGAKHGGRRVGAGRRVEQLRRRTVAPVMPEGVRELLRVLWRRVGMHSLVHRLLLHVQMPAHSRRNLRRGGRQVLVIKLRHRLRGQARREGSRRQGGVQVREVLWRHDRRSLGLIAPRLLRRQEHLVAKVVDRAVVELEGEQRSARRQRRRRRGRSRPHQWGEGVRTHPRRRRGRFGRTHCSVVLSHVLVRDGMPQLLHGRLLLERAVLLQQLLLLVLQQTVVVAHVRWQCVVPLQVLLLLLNQGARLSSLPHGLVLESGVHFEEGRVDHTGVGMKRTGDANRRHEVALVGVLPGGLGGRPNMPDRLAPARWLLVAGARLRLTRSIGPPVARDAIVCHT